MTYQFDPIEWVDDIHVIGAGGIGSWLGLFLIKQDVPSFHFYDDDIVEPHNLFTQFYWEKDLGKPKVEALAAFAEQMGSKTKVMPHVTRITRSGQLDLGGVVISGVDSMASRHDIWSHVKYNTDVELYMDGRIGGDALQLYTLNPSMSAEVNLYESWLYLGDEVVSDAPCSIRNDFHTAVALNGHILKNLTSFARGKRLVQILHGDLSVVEVPGGATPVVQIP